MITTAGDAYVNFSKKRSYSFFFNITYVSRHNDSLRFVPFILGTPQAAEDAQGDHDWILGVADELSIFSSSERRTNKRWKKKTSKLQPPVN